MVDLTAIGALLTIAAAAIVTILAQIQKSRCKTINICGIIRCKRDIPDVEVADEIVKHSNNKSIKNNQITPIEKIKEKAIIPNIQKWIDKK
jgi:hypothetical protein